MSPQAVPSSRPAGSGGTGVDEPGRWRSATRHLAVILFLGVLLGLALTSLVGISSATGPPGQFQTDNETDNTTVGPEIGSLSKVNDTAVALEIVDDTDVAEDTIDSRDFLLGTGRIENVTATEEGSNATALIELGSPLNTDELRISVPADASMEDTDGNGLNEPTDVTRTVGDMDGTPPLVIGYRARPSGDGGIDVRIETDDRLASLNVNVTGPESHDLRLEDFSRGTGSVYEATLPVQGEGEYTVELVELTDPHGNWDWLSQERTVTVDQGPPDAVAAVDLAATDGRNYTFDAGRSTDASQIANVTWDFDDGARARGERVTHRFDPGNYTVTARVTDVHGNTGTDNVSVTVGTGNASARAGAAGNASATVRLTGSDDGASAMIQVADARPGRAVRIPAIAGRSIAETSEVTFDALSVTTARNASIRLGVQVDSPASVRDVEASAGGSALAGVRLVHEVPDAAIAGANLTLTVDRSAIADAGGDPADVRVYRYHDGAWQALETAIEGRDNASVRYRAETPGFSRFAVVVGGEATTATDNGTDGSESTGTQQSVTPVTTTGSAGEDGSSGSSGGLLSILPLGLLELVVRYVGGIVVAGFLLLKSLALAMGY